MPTETDTHRPDATIVACASCGRKNRVPRAAPGAVRCARCHEPLPWLVDAGDDDFADVVDGARLPVLVDLWAPWCGPCRTVAPGVERAAREFAGRLKVAKVDVDQNPATAARFQARGIPTLLLLHEGSVVARVAGALPPPQLLAWVGEGLEAVAAG